MEIWIQNNHMLLDHGRGSVYPVYIEYQGLNPSEDVFGIDHRPDRFLADSLSDMSYFISSFSLPQAHSRVINTLAGTGHIFLIFSALTLFNRVI